MPAWLLPLALAGGFALLFAALFRDRLLPAPSVETALVLATAASTSSTAEEGNVSQTGGSLLFQASGWIEPDPFPIKAPALIDGVVASVHVLQGQQVEKGALLATLVDDDARLALATAEGRRRMLVSARDAHLAAISAMAKKRDGTNAEAVAIKTMEAEAADQQARLDRLAPSGAVSASEVTVARLRLEREKSLHQAALAKAAEFDAEVRRMELETKTKDDEISLAAVAVDQARLALERTRITAPVSGRVLRLTAAPGEKKMLAMEHPDSSTLCVLYEPSKLQVRVDVPLADAAGLRVGQKAKIHCSLFADKAFDGEVTRITGEADVQRNTLQAKVRILNPDDSLRPEMLCRVEFLGSEASLSDAGNRSAALATWIPPASLQGDIAWVCDPETKRVSKRTVQATGEMREGHVRIAEGLRPGEQVVLSPGNLREGQRVNPNLTAP